MITVVNLQMLGAGTLLAVDGSHMWVYNDAPILGVLSFVAGAAMIYFSIYNRPGMGV